MSVYATAANNFLIDHKAVSDTTPTQLVPSLTFKAEHGLWVKADPDNVATIYVARSDVSASGPGWPLVKGEEMAFNVSEVQLIYALAANNNDVVHIFVR